MEWKLKIKELDWFSIKSNRTCKSTIEREFSIYGLNLDKNITIFNFKKPNIIKDIIKNKKFDINKNIPETELRKFIFTVKTTSYNKYMIKSDESSYSI
jgi:hypothetical protein